MDKREIHIVSKMPKYLKEDIIYVRHLGNGEWTIKSGIPFKILIDKDEFPQYQVNRKFSKKDPFTNFISGLRTSNYALVRDLEIEEFEDLLNNL